MHNKKNSMENAFSLHLQEQLQLRLPFWHWLRALNDSETS